jgi:hypothetical protein
MKIRHVEQITRRLRPRTDTERSTKTSPQCFLHSPGWVALAASITIAAVVAGVAWQLRSWLADFSSGRFLPPPIIHPLRPWKAKSEQHQQNCQVDEGFAGIGLDQPEIVDHA